MNEHEIGLAVLAAGEDSGALVGRQNAVQVVVVGDGDQGAIAGKDYWGRCLRLRMLCRHLHPLILGNHQVKVAHIQPGRGLDILYSSTLCCSAAC